MTEETEVDRRAPVHLLIHEDFFLDKVDAAVRALEKEPVVPVWEEDVLEQVLRLPEVEMVLDLECEALEVVPLLERLRADERGAGMAVLGYCSHSSKDLIEKAQALGVDVVARSTFAANLVRLLQQLFRGGLDPEETVSETSKS